MHIAEKLSNYVMSTTRDQDFAPTGLQTFKFTYSDSQTIDLTNEILYYINVRF